MTKKRRYYTVIVLQFACWLLTGPEANNQSTFAAEQFEILSPAFFENVTRTCSDKQSPNGVQAQAIFRHLRQLLNIISETSQMPLLAHPVEPATLIPDTTPQNGKCWLATTLPQRLGHVRESIIISSADLDIDLAENSILISSGLVKAVHIRNCIIVGGHAIQVGHDIPLPSDGSPQPNDALRSVFVSGALLDVAHARNTVCLSRHFLRISHATSILLLKPEAARIAHSESPTYLPPERLTFARSPQTLLHFPVVVKKIVPSKSPSAIIETGDGDTAIRIGATINAVDDDGKRHFWTLKHILRNGLIFSDGHRFSTQLVDFDD